ncbi:unnamed protein product [Closterium sp. NIES-54]
MVTTTTPGGQRVWICTCTRTGRHLATFTHWPGSSLYTLTTEPPQVAASAQVCASGQVAASCSCRLLSHQNLLWHHRLGHPSLPRLRGMHSRLLVSGLPNSLPPLPPLPAPPCLPCIEGRQRATPHSSSFPPTTAPLRTLHMDVCGPARVILLRPIAGFLSFMLPYSPQQNGIAERRIGLVMEVAHTSMIHAAAPHFLWPFATSPTLRWTGKVGDASVDKLSARAIPCDVTFDESVPFYHLFPYRSAPSPPPPLFLAPGPSPVDPLPPQGPAPSGVSQVDPLPGTALVQVAVVSGAAQGAASGGAEPGCAGSEGAGSGGAELEGFEPGGAESEGAVPGGAESVGAESGGAEPRGAASSGGPTGASPRLSSQQLREWLVQRPHRRSGAPGAGEPGDAGAGDPTEPGAADAGGARAAGAGAVDPRARGAGGTVRPRPYFVPLLQQVPGVPSSTGLLPPFLCPPDQSQPPLQPASPLPVPSPYTMQSGGLPERRKLASRPVSPVCTAHRAPRLRPTPVPGKHTMALRPSSVPLRVPLPAPPESSLPEVPDPEFDRARAASPTVARLLATAITDPSFEFAAAHRLDYASALVADSVPASPPSVGGECALGTDVLEDRQENFECLAAAVPWFTSLLLAPEGDPDAPDIPTPRSYAEAITGPYSSQWQAIMDPEMTSWKSTGTYVDEVPPPGLNIVDGMWIFRVKRPPGSPPAFKARYVARGFSQRQGVDYFQTFSPTPKMTALRVLLHVAAQCDYELHSLDFRTAFLQGSLHEEIWLRRPPGFTGSFPAGTQWSLRWPVYSLRQAPREWHDTLRTTLAALGFVPSTADPSLFLHTDTSLPPFYVLVSFSASASSTPRHSLSSPPSDESIEPSAPYPELVLCLMHRKVHWDAAKRVLRYLSSCEAEIYVGAMAAQELRWLTYLLTDLGEQPRSPPVLYVDNKAMIALCQEHSLVHRMKHIALRYFLARELQQRGQLHLAYVATRANTADVFTKALSPGDHQRFVTVLGRVPTLPHLLTA